MSVIDAPLLQPHADSDTKRHSQYHVPAWVTRLAPKQGWDTLTPPIAYTAPQRLAHAGWCTEYLI